MRKGGFIVNKVIRLAENGENLCRQPNGDCHLLGYTDGIDAMARAVAEKTMCKCHICHTVPHNNIIAELWLKNGCCTAAQASFCLKQPITCCMSYDSECCFHPVSNRDQTCTSQGTFVQTVLFNRGSECSSEYEIVSHDAAISGSIVAAQLSTSDKDMFAKYNETCRKALCERKTYTGVRADDVSIADADLSKWFGIRIFISLDDLLTSVEEDRFSPIEAVVQLFGGFGLLFGMSLLTVFEMVSSLVYWLYKAILNKDADDDTDNQSFKSFCRQVFVGRALRSVNVFLTEKKKKKKKNQPNDPLKKASTLTSRNIVFAAPVDVDHAAINVPEGSRPPGPEEFLRQQIKSFFVNHMETSLPTQSEDESNKTQNTHVETGEAVISLCSLAVGILLAGYAISVLIVQISANNMDAKFDVSFNGKLSPPSMALCVRNENYGQLLNLTKQSECKQHDSVSTACVNHFNVRLQNTEETCLVKDNSRNSRIHSSNLRQFEDYNIVFATSQSGLKQLNFWFGDILSVRNGQLSPTEPFVLGESFDVIYTLLRSIKIKDCDDKSVLTICIQCEDEHRAVEKVNQCCLRRVQERTVNVTYASSLQPCTRNYYSIATVGHETSSGNMTVRLIDHYGVVDVITQEYRLTWSIILSKAQVRSIADHVRPDRQCMLFSATFKKKVERLAREALSDPVRIVQGEVGEVNSDILQSVEMLPHTQAKLKWLLNNLVNYCATGKVLVFVTKKADSEALATSLKSADLSPLLLHGDMQQTERNEVITRFRKEDCCKLLVATDVAARGLDIPEIRTVINYQLARDIDTHVHRVGRTGRAGHSGYAFTLVTPSDKEFSGHLVRNLESCGQLVPEKLMELAMQSSWFRNSRGKHVNSERASVGGRGLGFVEKGPTAGGRSYSSGYKHKPMLPLPAASFNDDDEAGPATKRSGAQGLAAGRLAALKTAFKSSYSGKFQQASSDTSWDGTRVTPSDPKSVQQQQAAANDTNRKRKSRWQ